MGATSMPESAAPNLGRAELARRIADTCRLRGEFTLRSGQTADVYFDKYLFEGDPSLLTAVARQIAPLIPPDIDILAGLELGGVPVVTALSLSTGLPAAFVRRTRKEYGTKKLAEGADVRGKRVLVIEDVVTTGGQVVDSVEALRHEGATVDHVLCVIDRTNGKATRLAACRLSLHALFDAAELS